MGGPPDKDFYVRDWWESAAVGDDGAGPSTHDFWVTSDIWNRRTNGPGTALDGFPDGQNAGNGSDNFAFARIRRRAAPGSGGQVQVTARLLVSRFGAGSSFVDHTIPNPTNVTFAPPVTCSFGPSDVGPVFTPGMQWHLQQTQSGHMCIAVQIDAPEDPFAGQLRGKTPGTAEANNIVLNDNNTAQRNLESVPVPAGMARGPQVDSFFAIVGNSGLEPGGMNWEVTVEPPEGLGVDEPIFVDVMGDNGLEEQVQVQRTAEFSMQEMQPGAKRWIGITVPELTGTSGQRLVVNFRQTEGGKAVNGFAFSAELTDPATILAQQNESHFRALTRISANGLQVPQPLLDEVRRVAGITRPTPDWYLDHVRDQRAAIEEAFGVVLNSLRGDPFGVEPALQEFLAATTNSRVQDVAVLHGNLINRVDAALTKKEVDAGDVFEILHTVRWHRHVLESDDDRQSPAGATLARGLDHFIDGIANGTVSYEGYPQLIANSIEQLAEMTPGIDLRSLRAASSERTDTDDLAAIQKAHRQYVLALANAETG